MRIPRERIETVRTTDITIAQAGGVGWRITGVAQYLLWSSGPAVTITLRGGRTFAVRTNHAEQLADILRRGEATP
jgi:hypothetical protein